MASTHYKRRWQWLAALIWAIVLLVASTLPKGNLPKLNFWSDIVSPDKAAHALFYGVFAVLLFLLLRPMTKRAMLWAFALATGYGAGMEFLQAWMGKGRAFELADMLANGLGALLAVVLLHYFYVSKKIKRES
ncbi:MAG: VanZ family protein [Bacteroidota bacterium]